MYEDFLDSLNGVLDEGSLYRACKERKLSVAKYGVHDGDHWDRTSAVISRKDGIAVHLTRNPLAGSFSWTLLPAAEAPWGVYFGYPSGEALSLEEALDALVDF